jgi:hypothetical protein
MRIRIVVDSATPAEVYNLTLAFQRSARFELPDHTQQQRDVPGRLSTEPTVTVCGIAMGWSSPYLFVEHAAAVLAEYDKLD